MERLDKRLANTRKWSRKEARELIRACRVRVDGGVCHADLSADLLQAVPERAEDQSLVISSIVETLCSLDKVEQVELLVEGQPLTAYGSLDLSGPLSPG